MLREGCLRVVTLWEPEGFVAVWPPGFGVQMQEGQVVVVNGGGRVIARVATMSRWEAGSRPALFSGGIAMPGEVWHAMTVRSTS